MLGDRLRMQAHVADAGVFIRSMATRGHLGGLARATGDAALVLDAAGKDVVIIETVGVGQDEVDIVRTADVSIVTLVPGTGDEVQALKAGIMEIADIFVVNKADREGADRLVVVGRGDALRCTPTARRRGGRRSSRPWRRPGKGVAELVEAIERFRAHTAATPGERGAGRAASTGCASWWRSASWSIVERPGARRRESSTRLSIASPRARSIPTRPWTTSLRRAVASARDVVGAAGRMSRRWRHESACSITSASR